MAAYLVFIREKVKDPAELEKYRSTGPAATKGYPMDVIVPFSPVELLEGKPIVGTAIVRFDSKEAAQTFYDSPAYQEATRHRLIGADYLTFIVEGP